MKWESEKTQQWALKKANAVALDPGEFHLASTLQASINGFADSV